MNSLYVAVFCLLAVCSVSARGTSLNSVVAKDKSESAGIPLEVSISSVPANFLRALETRDTKGVLPYYAGQRQVGDRLVAKGGQNQSWPTLQNVTVTVSYPQSGIGAIVTYLYCTVNQVGSNGRGYITSGGIGQRSITIVLEAYSTNYMNWQCEIYGV